MKVVILAGGLGTRLSELTHTVPKPMVEIGGKPIIIRLMEYYSNQGYNEFILALGYKAEYVKNYFSNYLKSINDLEISFEKNSINFLSQQNLNWTIKLIDTGISTQTGGRLKQLKEHLDDQFMLTYGDGLSNINLKELIKAHNSSNSLITISSVNPTSKYGKLIINEDSKVTSFVEKPLFGSDWINAGFMVVKKDFIDLIDDKSSVLEQEPFARALKLNRFSAFKHYGFWKCMDTLRDKTEFDEICNSGNLPWLEDFQQ